MKKTFLIQLTEEQKQAMKKAAEEENRSMSNFIVTVVMDYINNK